MRGTTPTWRLAAVHLGAGVTLALLVLHPVTMAIYWFEFHPAVAGVGSASEFALDRVTGAFTPTMLPMTAAFAVLGLFLGGGSALYAHALRRRERQLARLHAELGRDLATLIGAGEGERLEFKASARWDRERGAGNRDLEIAVVRSIAGFLNARGGTLLIGVADDGSVVGLDKDYHTLRAKGRDGFERFLMGVVAKRLGTDVCPLVHVLFHDVEGLDVCRVTVEPSPLPVFLADGDGSRFFLRAGNATRELDAEEVVRLLARG